MSNLKQQSILTTAQQIRLQELRALDAVSGLTPGQVAEKTNLETRVIIQKSLDSLVKNSLLS